MMLKHCLLILTLFISILGFSQEEDSYVFGDKTTSSSSNSSGGGGFDWDRVTIGGGLFLQFGTNSYVAVSPTLGYYLTDNIIVGVGGSYVYEERTYAVTYPYRATTYSGMVFAEYIFENLPILLHGELEQARIDIKYLDFSDHDTFDMTNVYVGGGLKQKMGGNSYLYAMVLYNLNETKESNYFQTNPIIRIGIAIGL